MKNAHKEICMTDFESMSQEQCESLSPEEKKKELYEKKKTAKMMWQ